MSWNWGLETWVQALISCELGYPHHEKNSIAIAFVHICWFYHWLCTRHLLTLALVLSPHWLVQHSIPSLLSLIGSSPHVAFPFDFIWCQGVINLISMNVFCSLSLSIHSLTLIFLPTVGLSYPCAISSGAYMLRCSLLSMHQEKPPSLIKTNLN